MDLKYSINQLLFKVIFVMIFAIIANISCSKDELMLPILRTMPVDSIAHGYAYTGGEIRYFGDASIETMGVVWNSVGKPTLYSNDGMTQDTIDDLVFQRFSSIISGIQKHNTYYVRSYATNIHGTGYGNEIFFTVYDTIIDYDGNTYNTIIIGDQEWMAENLRVTHFDDGREIPYIHNIDDWNNLSTAAYAYYPHSQIDQIFNSDDVISSYGLLYNWYTADDNKLCPDGWRVPDVEDWEKLINFVAVDSNTSETGNLLKSCHYIRSPLGGDCSTEQHPRWDFHSKHFGLDSYGFHGIPGGQRAHGYYVFLGRIGSWWTSSEASENNAYYYYMLFDNSGVHKSNTNYKTDGLSVRCMKDLPK